MTCTRGKNPRAMPCRVMLKVPEISACEAITVAIVERTTTA